MNTVEGALSEAQGISSPEAWDRGSAEARSMVRHSALASEAAVVLPQVDSWDKVEVQVVDSNPDSAVIWNDIEGRHV